VKIEARTICRGFLVKGGGGRPRVIQWEENRPLKVFYDFFAEGLCGSELEKRATYAGNQVGRKSGGGNRVRIGFFRGSVMTERKNSAGGDFRRVPKEGVVRRYFGFKREPQGKNCLKERSLRLEIKPFKGGFKRRDSLVIGSVPFQ